MIGVASRRSDAKETTSYNSQYQSPVEGAHHRIRNSTLNLMSEKR